MCYARNAVTSPLGSRKSSARFLPTWAVWIIPIAFCLIVCWYGLTAWFQEDDWAWLQLREEVHSAKDLFRAIFMPTGHGTFRPLSERLFFLVFSSLFGLNALPYRICAFATQFANLILLGSITWRLSRSRLAGVSAPIFWVANANLAMVMAWSSGYMQLLCGFFLLLAFHFLLRHIETGERRYYVFQWIAFLIGFGAMETTVVYPALAATYTFLCARKYFRRTLPLFAASGLFLAFHTALAPKLASGPYGVHFDSSMPQTFLTYWIWSFVPRNLQPLTRIPESAGYIVAVAATVALLGFVAWSAVQRRWVPLFLLGWYVIVLAPVLPLRDHVSAYYLTLPTTGLAMLGGYALGFSWSASKIARIAAVPVAAAVLLVWTPAARASVKWWHDRSRSIESMVRGVQSIRARHPQSAILLTGVDTNRFWGAVLHNAFLVAGVRDVYLAQESEKRIEAHPELGDIKPFLLPEQSALDTLSNGLLVVYDIAGPRPENVTRKYEEELRSRIRPSTPARVDVGNPLMSPFVGRGWYAAEGGFRWMGRRAALRLAGPQTLQQKLHISGYCPAVLLSAGALELAVSVDGRRLGSRPITAGGAPFEQEFALPADLVGRPEMQVGLEVSRTFRPVPEDPELGLVFGVFCVQ